MKISEKILREALKNKQKLMNENKNDLIAVHPSLIPIIQAAINTLEDEIDDIENTIKKIMHKEQK
jgi:hypothetical protein